MTSARLAHVHIHVQYMCTGSTVIHVSGKIPMLMVACRLMTSGDSGVNFPTFWIMGREEGRREGEREKGGREGGREEGRWEGEREKGGVRERVREGRKGGGRKAGGGREGREHHDRNIPVWVCTFVA